LKRLPVKKENSTKSVLINVFADNVWIIGFVTDEELHKFEFGAEMIAVYVPQAYNFAGQLYMLPRDRVKKIDNVTSGQAMKLYSNGRCGRIGRRSN